MSANPIQADGNSRQKAKRGSPSALPKPNVGIDPQKTPKNGVNSCQKKRVTKRAGEPVAEILQLLLRGHFGMDPTVTIGVGVLLKNFKEVLTIILQWVDVCRGSFLFVDSKW